MLELMARAKSRTDVRAQLLDAAVNVIRAKGYSAATVDDICRSAGVTKGGFFHHFESKEELAVSAVFDAALPKADQPS